MSGNGLAEDIVLRAGTIFRVKTKDLALVGCAWHCFLLEDVAFEELDIRCWFGGGCAAAARIVTL